MASSIVLKGYNPETNAEGNPYTITNQMIAFKGITVTIEKIWSTDTGRSVSSNALMQGKVVAIKHTFKVKCSTLTATQYNAINNVISNKNYPFCKVTLDDGVKSYGTLTMYAGSTSTTVYNDKLGKYLDFSFDLIER